jgi:hypothetical protein
MNSSRSLRQTRRSREQERLSFFLDDIQADQDRRHAWLYTAGPIARQLNLDSKDDPR